MNDSPTRTRRSSTSSPLTRKRPDYAKASSGRPASHKGFFRDQPGFVQTLVLVLVDALLLVLAIYFMQEGIAQQTKPHFTYFDDFPTKFLPAVYAAAGLLIINLAFLILSLRHRTAKHRWTWVTTAIALLLLVLIVWQIGLDGVRIIIDPSSA